MPRRRFAFFDVDETLISMKSMFDFFPYWCDCNGTPEKIANFQRAFERARARKWTREQLNCLYYSFFEDAELAAVEDAGQHWFRARFEVAQPPVLTASVAQLRAHAAAGVDPVFVSGSMQPLLRPIATSLGVSFILCARPRTDPHGRLTGELELPPTIGKGKAEVVRRFLTLHGADATECFAYGDDLSDVPMLEVVGNAVTVGDHGGLRALGQTRGWSHLSA
jgi:HAD superfamily hydrolase (TIGR01490 family)